MGRRIAPDERFEQLRLGESLEATDDELHAYVTKLLDRGGPPPAEPDWLQEAMDRRSTLEPVESED
jgi:hypothetical protein